MNFNILNTRTVRLARALTAAMAAVVLFAVTALATVSTEAAPVSSKDDDLVISTKDGFNISTVDGDYGFSLNARLLYDVYYFEGVHNRSDIGDDPEAEPRSDSDATERDVRITLSGKANNWHFKLGYNFVNDGDFTDAYVRYTGWGNWAQLTLGNQKVPFGVDQLTSFTDILALERNILNQAFSVDRQEGISLAGYNDMFSYHVGVYELDSDFAFGSGGGDDTLQAARFTVRPVETALGSFHLGWAVQKFNVQSENLAASPPEDFLVSLGVLDMGSDFASAATSSVTLRRFVPADAALRDAQTGFVRVPTEVHEADPILYPRTLVYDGIRDFSFEVAGSVGPVYLQFEYMDRKFEGQEGFSDMSFDGFSTQVAWTITGERRSYDSERALYSAIEKPSRGIGAWEIYFRYSELDLAADWDDPEAYVVASATDAASAALLSSSHDYESFTVGLNWYINKRMRMNLSITEAEAGLFSCIGRVNLDPAPTNVPDYLCYERDADNNDGQAVGLRFQYTY